MKVKVWEEEVSIPTYEIGAPEKSPMFLEKRVYQGSCGSVYPYPVVEKISDVPQPKNYHAVWLENEYVKVMILPELGGRVQMAYDKIKNRHFVYYNHVIKPALVGLTGPWISGGIEFNWPQHHRPSTYTPVDFTIEELADGGATIWVGEQERMFHQKGTAGFTLRPGQARLEIQGKVSNPTPVPQTFLWWANPAVSVNDDYQSVFPPDVNAVFDHGKRDVATFPIATGTYYKMDYSAGVDISRYKNIPVPTSYMAIKSDYDFVGGYENDTRAGVLHVANHHVSPGKKQWTWGNGDFGKAWDRNLTDEDGPYIELMTGMYCDNQPDFTWLQPYEEKTFVQYFIPYRELGVVKQACVDLLLNIDRQGGQIVLQLFATRLLENAKVKVMCGAKVLLEETATLSPEQVFEKRVDTAAGIADLTVEVTDANARPILTWKPEKDEIKPVPDPAKAALLPGQIQTTEQLFLTGQHLEQYRHATYDPTDYYLEALRRDPSDIRNNNAYGLWLLRKGRFAEAEQYLDRAIATQLVRNPNPYDGEPLYNRGLAQKFQYKTDAAYASFYKACWNAAWQDAGYYALAQLSVLKGNDEEALSEVDKSLMRNWSNHRARHLKAAVLRRLGRTDEALALIAESLRMDKFNFGAMYERFLITGAKADQDSMLQLMRTDSHNYQEIAWDYFNAGLYTEAVGILDCAVIYCTAVSPMVYYIQGLCYACMHDEAKAVAAFRKAEKQPADYCFPNRLEDILALECAQKMNPAGARAYYYLGNLYYDKRQHDRAIACWERSIELDATFPIALRNLALGYFNKLQRTEEAVNLLEKAYALDESDARILMELDQLYKRLNRPHAERFAKLNARVDVVKKRDDLYLEYATLLNQLGEYAQAKTWIDDRKFHPWEGGEGKVPAQYQICRLQLARKAIREGDYADAEKLLLECYEYPYHLGEGKLRGAQENDFNYYLGCAYEGMGQAEKARQCFELASIGLSEPVAAIYYNDQKPDKIFYQGMALLKLGREEEARSRFNRLIVYGEKHLYDQIRIDYFAVSLPDLLIWEDDLTLRNRIHCHYLMGLGYLGLQHSEKARLFLAQAAEADNNHQGVQIHLEMV